MQNNNEMVIDVRKVVIFRNLILANLILIALSIFPYIGTILNMFFGALTIAILVLTLLILRYEVLFRLSKFISLSALVASGLGLIAGVITIYIMFSVLFSVDLIQLSNLDASLSPLLAPYESLMNWAKTMSLVALGFYFVAFFGYYFRFKKVQRFIRAIREAAEKVEE